MPEVSEKTKVALTVGGAFTLAGGLLYAGWFANGLLRDIKDDVAGLRRDLKSASSDRWTGADMRDYVAQATTLNAAVVRTDGQAGLKLPDVRHIQRGNREEGGSN